MKRARRRPRSILAAVALAALPARAGVKYWDNPAFRAFDAGDYVTNGLGSHYPRTDEMFKGTIKNFRFYYRVLSDEEVAWNRVVNEARSFGRRAAIPATNVVVSTTIDGLSDDHFAIDDEGFTFTAPAQRTAKGRRYVLNGYTLETWNGSGWDPATMHDGDSYDATSSGKVRLTWQYERPAGEGRSGDYVCPPSGVMAFYNALSCPKEIAFVQGATHLAEFPADPLQVSRRSSQPTHSSP